MQSPNTASTLQVGVKILVSNETGEYLLLHRSKEKYPEVLHPWDIPGGRIHAGVPLLDNLQREVKEETGLELSSEPELIGAQDIFPTQDRHVVRLTYRGTARGVVVLNGEEHDSFAWIAKSELSKHEGLDMYLARLLQSTLAL